jgi:hypothetical protein
MVLKQSYDEWKGCIISNIESEFNKDFIRTRLKILENTEHPETQNFLKTYGLKYTNRMISYFKQALNEIK